MTGRSSPTRVGSPLYASHHSAQPHALGLSTRFAGALALIATGAVHLQQYIGAHYSDIPTIGTLFVLNFAGATILALALLAPLERLAGRRGTVAVTFSALAGIGLAATSFVFLLVSEHHTLFGFREAGYRTPIVIALVAEAAAVTLLACFLALRTADRAPKW